MIGRRSRADFLTRGRCMTERRENGKEHNHGFRPTEIRNENILALILGGYDQERKRTDYFDRNTLQ